MTDMKSLMIGALLVAVVVLGYLSQYSRDQAAVRHDREEVAASGVFGPGSKVKRAA